MDSFGQTIRKLREEKELPLRTVAAYLDIDQAILSKIERGQRNANRGQVIKLAEFFKVKENDLIVSWLSDKLVSEVEDENMALEAFQVAEEKVYYRTKNRLEIPTIISGIEEVLKKDGRVVSAWLFGSVLTKEAQSTSDVDIIVELNERRKYSMFDLMDIAHSIEQKINRKVDLVEKGQLYPFAWETASPNMLKVYG